MSGSDALITLATAEWCHAHPGHAPLIYCRPCCSPICLECSYGDHKGHETILARERKQELLDSLGEIDHQLKGKEDALTAKIQEGRRQIFETDKLYQDRLKRLKAEHNDEIKQMKSALAESQSSVTEVAALRQSLASLTSSSPLRSVTEIISEVAAMVDTWPYRAPQQTVEILDDDRRHVATVARRAAEERGRGGRSGDVVVLTSYLSAFLQYAHNTHLPSPGPVQSVEKRNAYKSDQLQYLKPRTGRDLTNLFGNTAVVSLARNKTAFKLTDDKWNVTHVHVQIQEMPSNVTSWWYLPSKRLVRDAVRLVLNWVPAKIEDSKGWKVDAQTVEDVVKTSGETLVCVWK